MTADLPALVRAFSVGRYTVTLTVPRIPTEGIACGTAEWSPYMPARLTEAERKQYQAAMRTVIAELNPEASPCS